ncbi:MAG TPA: ribonuclease III [Limnobacter sp.]|nr:ribonuclease III [Limnobacter sp.]
MDRPDHASLEHALGHRFCDQGLLRQALTHRSYSTAHNERLEFLGDSVLNCAASILLYGAQPDMDEGKLSRVRSHLVKQDCLANIGRTLQLEQHLYLGAGELRSAKTIKDSIVADALEALFGAILLDSDFEHAKACVIRLLEPVLLETPLESLGKDPKTRLQEHLQAKRMKLPVYSVLVEGGTSSSPEFKVQCHVQDLDIVQVGAGHSRRVAEQHAAQAALIELLEREYADPNQANIKGLQ